MSDFVFDPHKDYYEDLSSDELIEGKPLLKGLKRLARLRGIRSVHSDICASPTANNKVAAVCVQYTFDDPDGTVRIYCGSADATPEAINNDEVAKHLVAVAESKAEARALRRAFNIVQVSAEEIQGTIVGGNPDNEPINSAQITGINNVIERKKLSMSEALKLIKSDVSDLSELSSLQGRNLMKALNKVKIKN